MKKSVANDDSFSADLGPAPAPAALGPAAAPAPMPPPPATALPSQPGGDEKGSAIGGALSSGSGIAGSASGIAGLGSRGADKEEAHERAKARQGLGTEYGESVSSYIRNVYFERATSYPNAILGLRYNDREGLLGMGIDVDGNREARLRETANPFPVVDRGYAQPPPGWSR